MNTYAVVEPQNNKANKQNKVRAFKINPNFQRFKRSILINLQGLCFLQSYDGLTIPEFGREIFYIKIENAKLFIKNHNNQIKRCVNFNAVSASVAYYGMGFFISFIGTSSIIYVQPFVSIPQDLTLTKQKINQLFQQYKNLSKQKRIQRLLQQNYKWVTTILKATVSSKGVKHFKNYLIKNNKDNIELFYQKEHITNLQFQNSADTFDLILFQQNIVQTTIENIKQFDFSNLKKQFNKNIKIVKKMFTQNVLKTHNYHDVGIVVRSNNNKLYILKKIDKHIKLEQWKLQYPKQNEQIIKKYKKICWRQLKIKLNQDLINEFQECIQKYAKQMLDKQTYNIKGVKQLDISQIDLPFHQIIANLYKKLKILQPQKEIKDYTIDDFIENNLKFTDPSVELSNQKMISLKIENDNNQIEKKTVKKNKKKKDKQSDKENQQN